jgi:two-component system, cell cycle response regulator DivK
MVAQPAKRRTVTAMSKPGSKDSVPKGRVLCIEDSPIGMYMVESAIADFPNVSLTKAGTGAEGIRVARRERPDLVLLDLHLPDLHGLDVVRALRDPAAGGGLRIVLLTADTLSGDIVEGLRLGACEYWHKPLSLSELRQGLQRLLGGHGSDR